MSQRKPPVSAAAAFGAGEPAQLLADLRQLIDGARRSATVAVNAAQTMLYWHVGRRIRAEVLGEQRARYGQEIVVTLSRQLVTDYVSGAG